MDIKRTLLWAVLTISGLMLYNNWLIYDGRQALFGPLPLTPTSQAPTSVKGQEKDAQAGSTQNQPTAPSQPKTVDLPKQEGLPKQIGRAHV